MAKTIVKPWVKVFGVIVAVSAIVFGLYSLGQNGKDGSSFNFNVGNLFGDDSDDLYDPNDLPRFWKRYLKGNVDTIENEEEKNIGISVAGDSLVTVGTGKAMEVPDAIKKAVEDAKKNLVKIPMYGETNSLNASVAAGIMIYEVIRNRK